MKQNINALTGNNQLFLNQLKESISKAESIDIIVSFLMESGVKLILNDLKEAVKKGTKIRILTGSYLKITQPQALYLLKKELGNNIDLCFYDDFNKSFHPKAYIFHYKEDSEIYIGSSNLSKGALTDSIEWNYHFRKSEKEEDFNKFYSEFEDLFNNHSLQITDEILREYSKTWTPQKFTKETTFNQSKFEPHGAQIEALYALEKSREEGFDKGLVVAATGIGKTYLAAFDSLNYDRILFIAHREEIIHQAAESFHNIHPNKSIGYFYNNKKDTDKDFTFALVQTLGKDRYLNEKYFKPDDFDYIVVDEFHHAAADSYTRILNYFKPKFLLGLTATPERLDNKDVFALCDYNEVYELRLKEAISKGWLVPFRYYGIYDDTVNYSEINMRYGRYDEKSLEEKLMINKRGELVYKHYMKYSSKCAIGFCSSKNHAEYMAQYFNEKGIASAAVYSGEQGEFTSARDEAISKLKNGELKIIFCVDMFNEGVDIPSVDMVLFLRPTQSPTIFLQQLGRGLRKSDGKNYLTILDFIGNYKKANLVPFLLSGYNYDSKVLIKENPLEFEYPPECFIDFDFELVDLFKEQSKNELKIKDMIKIEFDTIKEELGHRPSRLELFLRMDDSIISAMRRNSKFNLFKDYLGFLEENDELFDEEKIFLNTKGHEFLNVLENTSMTKSYKMPILKAFYNEGDIKLGISSEDVAKNMKEFYSYKSNGVDMHKDNSSKDYLSWSDEDYVKLAIKNPIKFLKKTHSEFFVDCDDGLLGLTDEIKEFIGLDSFKQHFKDTIEYRTMNYYKTRFEKSRGSDE